MSDETPVAVVAGVGPGLGTALCRHLATAGYRVAALARNQDRLDDIATAISPRGGGLVPFACDVTDPKAVRETFGRLRQSLGPPAVLVYNAGAFLMRSFAESTPEEFRTQWETNAYGGFLCAHEVVSDMVSAGRGTIIFTGATASVKPAARFSAFGSAKFALRGMAQAMARELGPQGIHVAHVVIDGVIWTPRTRDMPGVTEHNTLDAEAIAATYLHLIRQERAAWTHELDLRPSQESF